MLTRTTLLPLLGLGVKLGGKQEQEKYRSSLLVARVSLMSDSSHIARSSMSESAVNQLSFPGQDDVPAMRGYASGGSKCEMFGVAQA